MRKAVWPHAKFVALDDRFSITVHPILEAQVKVAAHLENTTELERPRDFTGGCEEPSHLHNVTSNPAGEHGEPEALARSQSVVREDLRHGQCGFDREAGYPKTGRVDDIYTGECGEHELVAHKGDEHIHDELPVSVGISVR